MKKVPFVKILLLSVVLLAIAGAAVAKIVLHRVTASEEFRRFAEERAGQYLKAKVSIGRIRPYHLNQIALENVILELPSVKGRSQLVSLDRLLFRYHWKQLWNRKYEEPAMVTVSNPSFVIGQDEFPYQYFEAPGSGHSGLVLPALDFRGGEIRYLITSLGKEIVLTDIIGKINQAQGTKVRIGIRATARGILSGLIAIHGTVDPVNKTHDLWLELDETDLSSDIPLPLRGLSGKIRWTGKDLFFEDVRAVLHGWSAKISGVFKNQDGDPAVRLRIKVGNTEKKRFEGGFFLDLNARRIEGEIDFGQEQRFFFEGTARSEGRFFVMDPLIINGDYQGKGEIDFFSGNYELSVEKDSKRISVASNLKGLDFAIRGKLDHLKLLGLDIVTQGRIYIHAVQQRWSERQFFFKGNIETDYFIVNQQPLQDLKGSFEISPYGISAIRWTWGQKFEMTGSIGGSLKEPRSKLTVRAANFDLGKVQFFASKPLPREMGGRLDGRLMIEGDLGNPEIIGIFNVREGKWGKIDYDRGIIRFRGFAPYFPLQESKIWKGRSVFFLTGAVDLTLDNIMAGIKIETLDRLVVWKGIEVTLHEKDGSIQVAGKKLPEAAPLSSIYVEGVKPPDIQTGDGDEVFSEDRGVTIETKVKF